jgi:phosphatidate phosphatase APP1
MPASFLSAMTRRPPPAISLAPPRGAVLPNDPALEDRVVLFPSLGHLTPGGDHWVVGVHGDVFTRGRIGLTKRMLLKLLQRAMRAPDEAMASEIFQQRIARFVANDRVGCRVAVRIADQVHVLPKTSRRNGHFQAVVRVPVSRLPPAAETSGQIAAPIQLEVCGLPAALSLAAGPLAAGQAYLVGRTGLSIISDIDDTLKHSYVACKRTLLANTFLRPFEAIPGMAPLFREWEEQGAAFHYVSSSPWQLYPHLAEHLASEGFPAGSYHLRAFRLRDHLIRRLLMLRRSGKSGVIRSLFKMFPERRFLMIGDSGEHDPEIYGAMARRYPHQVAGILIRQLDGSRNSQARYARAFRGVPYDAVRLYRDASELTDVTRP